jgi:hypothetical protein
MRITIKSKEDFLSGLMFMGFGVVAVVTARNYPMGTTMRMGPGYFPTCLGALLVLMGLAIAVRALRRTAGTEASHGFAWRPLILLSAAFALFGILMDYNAGFIPSLVALIVTCVFAGREFRLRELVLLTVTLVIASLAIFIYGIDLPFPLFWWS